MSLQSATAAGICPGWRASESPFSFGFRSFSLPFLFYFLVLFFSCFFVFCFHFYYSLSAFLFFAYFSFLFLSALEMCLREKSRLSTRLAFGSQTINPTGIFHIQSPTVDRSASPCKPSTRVLPLLGPALTTWRPSLVDWRPSLVVELSLIAVSNGMFGPFGRHGFVRRSVASSPSPSSCASAGTWRREGAWFLWFSPILQRGEASNYCIKLY